MTLSYPQVLACKIKVGCAGLGAEVSPQCSLFRNCMISRVHKIYFLFQSLFIINQAFERYIYVVKVKRHFFLLQQNSFLYYGRIQGYWSNKSWRECLLTILGIEDIISFVLEICNSRN